LINIESSRICFLWFYVAPELRDDDHLSGPDDFCINPAD
jgi:hypothetical protein